MYIDTHCHLQFSDFNVDRAMVIGNAKKAGIKQFIVPGTDLVTSRRSLELSRQHSGVVFSAVGFHPYEAQKIIDVSDLNKLINDSVVAIGECGLDYHIYKDEKAIGKKDNQKRLFESQLSLALQLNLPVIMHCRDGFADFFDVLDSLPQVPHGVVHCFSGGLQELRFAQKRGLFVGTDGNVTYSKQLARIVPEVPLSMLVLETDAPYLTPIQHRGSRNEPKYIQLIAKKVAELKNISVREVEAQTTANAQQLFQIS